VEANAAFPADLVSGDGLWTRLVYQDRPAWVLTISLVEAESFNQINAIAQNQFMPMQAFYFRTGSNQSGCDRPDLLMAGGELNRTSGPRATSASVDWRFRSDVIAVSGEVVVFPHAERRHIRRYEVSFASRTSKPG
jgi:hypothetical protein